MKRTLADPDLMDFIESRLVQPRHDCLIWTGTTDRGYGKVWLGSPKRVHRVLWELKHGPIPAGLTIDHLCRVRACANTDHMELVTAVENNRRKPVPVNRRLTNKGFVSEEFIKQATQQWAAAHPKPTGRPASQRIPGIQCANGHRYAEVGFRVEQSGIWLCLACRAETVRRASQRRREIRALARQPQAASLATVPPAASEEPGAAA